MSLRHLVHHAHHRLAEDAGGGHDDVEPVPAHLPRAEEHLVLPVDQDVPDSPLHEGGGGAPCPGIQHRHVLEEADDELPRPGLVTAPLLQGVAPGGQVVPPGHPGGLRVGGDHRDPRPHQVLPVLDLLRIPLPHQEDDGGGVGGAVVGEPALPVPGKELRLLGDGVDVVGEGQGHHVGLQAVDHGPGLLARSAVGLLDAQRLTGLLLPVPGEGGVELLVELPGRIVGDVQKGDVLRRGRRPQDRPRRGRGEQDDLKEFSQPHDGIPLMEVVHGTAHGRPQKAIWNRLWSTFSSGRSPPDAAPPSNDVRL